MSTRPLDKLQAALGPSYVAEREIGRGGMATVFLVRDLKHGRSVALKVLDGNLASADAERFRREIAVTAGLHHPHILTVLDSGTTSCGHPWFTTPYVEGENLRHRLDREGALPVVDAVRIGRQTAEALAYAHGRGIIHRDIKPENILLSGGHALVADFGIARLVTDDGQLTGGALTSAGMAIGTLGYMSPEQASGVRPLDARTDVFSLGVVLYEMLAGQPPFSGAMADAHFAAMVSNDPPSVRIVRPEVPESLDAVLRRALAPTPADRWASGGEFATALATTEWSVMGTAAAAPAGSRPTASPARAAWIHRVPIVVLALAVGIAIAAGGLAAWTGTHADRRTGASTGVLRLAVLPFENIGDSSDAYFAEGMTAAVRTKLAGLPGLEVVGSASAAQYRHTTKTPQEIGRELDVSYVLEGKVQWAKGPNGASRVRVSPELIDTRTAADKWDEPFDAPLTGVFEVQSDIAGRVARQLEVALTPAAERTLASRPTTSLSAYEYYLRGEALETTGGGLDVTYRDIALFQAAVTQDSTFALAWAALARAQALEYTNGVPNPALADSVDRGSTRALALAPTAADPHVARATYYIAVARTPVLALHEDSLVLALAPHDANALRRTADVEARLGRWDAASAHAAEALELDPQSVQAAAECGFIELFRRRYTRAGAALEQAAALSPTKLGVIEERVLVMLGEGDLTGARTLLRAVPASIDRNKLVAYIATYIDLGWALDASDADRVLTLRPAEFGDDRATWAFALTQQYAFQGDRRHARIYADTARLAYEAELVTTPDDAEGRALLGVTLAYLGRRDDAIREGTRATALLPIGRDALLGPYIQYQLVRIYTLLGEPARALDALEPLLGVPYTVSPAWLRIDPNLAPLRDNPRFRRLATDASPPELPQRSVGASGGVERR